MPFDARTAVTVTAHSRVALPPGPAMDAIAPVDLPRIIRPLGPLPGVREVRDQSGPWDAAGRTRTIVLTDGSTTRERLIEWAPGASFAYELSELTGLLAQLAAGVRGEWSFTPDGSGAIVRWTWELTPKRGRGPILRFVFAPIWRHAMQATVDRCREVASANR